MGTKGRNLLQAPARKERPPVLHLRLLNLTDLHMDIRGYDYFADRPTVAGGLVRAAGVIDALRAEVSNCLLFDNGDALQGNPLGDYAAHKIGRDHTFPHPMIAALNALDIDCATLGNHEFNYGLPVLRAALAQVRFPVVSANVATRKGVTPWDDRTLFPPFALLSRRFTDTDDARHDLTIGVLGLLPPQIVHWDRKHLAGVVQTRDIVEAGAHYAAVLRQAGADLVIALCHSGIEDADEPTGLENAAVPLAALDGIDVVVAGHSHLVFPSADFSALPQADLERGLIHGTPTTLAGFGGSHVGRVELTLAQEAGAWRVRAATASVEPVSPTRASDGPSAAAILRITEAAHRGALRYVRQPVGRTVRALDSYLAMVEPASSVRLVATAQAWFLRQALDGSPLADLPLLSAAAPFKMGGRGGATNFTDVPAGDIAMRNVADLYGYPNLLRAVRISGRALRDWLEYSAGQFRCIVPGAVDQPLIDPAFASYNFDTITGVTYTIDLTNSPRFTRSGIRTPGDAGRILDLCYNGDRVTDDMAFLVATNDYRTSGSGNYPGADEGEVVFDTHQGQRDILVRFLRATRPERSLQPSPWRFRTVENTSVLFETGKVVARDPARLRARAIEPLSLSKNGFLLCRKHL